jgi:hypothetical protein
MGRFDAIQDLAKLLEDCLRVNSIIHQLAKRPLRERHHIKRRFRIFSNAGIDNWDYVWVFSPLTEFVFVFKPARFFGRRPRGIKFFNRERRTCFVVVNAVNAPRSTLTENYISCENREWGFEYSRCLGHVVSKVSGFGRSHF